MIEEIKLLLPLLEGVADGGMTLIAILLSLKALSMLLVSGVIIYIVRVVAYTVAVQSESYKIANELRREVVGRITSYGQFTESEKRSMYEAISLIKK